jgi:uncharacterized membrane protein
MMSITSRWLRLLRHRWFDERDAAKVLDPAALDRLRRRVEASERRHAGQIRLCIEAGLPLSYLWRGAGARERAVALFGKLGVWDTEHNNGVLIYLLLAEHAIEVVADRGLARHVPDGDWAPLLHGMAAAFAAGRFEDGLAAAIDIVGERLALYFPADAGRPNVNELPDEPVLR